MDALKKGKAEKGKQDHGLPPTETFEAGLAALAEAAVGSQSAQEIAVNHLPILSSWDIQLARRLLSDEARRR